VVASRASYASCLISQRCVKCDRKWLRSVLINCNTDRDTEGKGEYSLDKDIRSPEFEFKNSQKFLRIAYPQLLINLLAVLPLLSNDFSNFASKISPTPQKRKIHGRYTTSVTFFVLRWSLLRTNVKEDKGSHKTSTQVLYFYFYFYSSTRGKADQNSNAVCGAYDLPVLQHWVRSFKSHSGAWMYVHVSSVCCPV